MAARLTEYPLNPDDPVNFLGNLPESGTTTLMMPDTVPSDAKKWLVYTYVTVCADAGTSGRAYYEFYGTEGDSTYHRFMNVGFFGDSVINSMNFWLPANTSRTVNVELVNAVLKQKNKKAPGSCGLKTHLATCEGTSTGAFVIAYEK